MDKKSMDARQLRSELNTSKLQIEELDSMTIPELQEKWLDLCGKTTTANNKAYLIKRIAWKMQAIEEGGLSPRAEDRINELVPDAPIHWSKSPRKSQGRKNNALQGEAEKQKRRPTYKKKRRDPRLPEPGTVIVRTHKGVDHEVTVLEEGFQYKGEIYKSLSQVAEQVTGTHWNGFVFFGLKQSKQK